MKILLIALAFVLQEKNAAAFPNAVSLKENQNGMKSDVLKYVGNKEDSSLEEFKKDTNIFDFNPEVILSTPELIARDGYPAESHTVKTEDGYLLTLHRIPRGKLSPTGCAARRTILLQHGLLSSSADWVINGPARSLAYILADAGYDVWMGNARGNTYSRAHVSLDPDSSQFWNFTWHEIGTRDLPAVIDYIDSVKCNKDKIYYVGHSMGTTVLFVLLASCPEYNQRIRAGYALAPVAYMSDIKAVAKVLAPFTKYIRNLLSYFGIYNMLPQSYWLRWLVKIFCERNQLGMIFCENVLFAIIGYDAPQFMLSKLPAYLGHAPAGSSTKSFVHYAQLIKIGTKFQQFDYGSDSNMQQYGSETPPEYPLDKITSPISLFVARNDPLSAVVDAKKLYKKIANGKELYIVPWRKFNHLDFLWARDANKLVYKKLLELMSKDKL